MHIVNVCSPTWKLAESYGRIAIELAEGLDQAGMYVNRVGAGVGNPSLFMPTTGAILLGYPTLWNEFGPLVNTGPRIALTMFESTRLPEGWVERLNTVDAVIVPSTWLVDVFKTCGVTVPIHVVPLGISRTFKQVKRREVSKPFRFIAVADRGWRKGWWQALNAFVRFAGSSMDYELVLKGRHAEDLKKMQNPNVRVIDDNLTDEQMVELYHDCHVMLAPNCAEGFGFLPREFAATGGVVLTTNWGGTADDLQWWGTPVPYVLGNAWNNHPEWKSDLGVWAEPDIEALASLMGYVVHQYDTYQEFALRAAGYVVSHYRWSLFASQVKAIWQQVVEKHNDANRSRANAIPA